MPTLNDRRANDSVAEELLKNWQAHVDARLTKQDEALKTIDTKLDDHIRTAGDNYKKVEPVVEAMDGMRVGIKVIGWLGSKVTAIGLLVSAVIGALLAWKGYFK